MRAMLLHSFGETPDFRLENVPMPEVLPGRVLIRVAATSVNPIDIKIRTTRPAFAPKLPAILGKDVAGVVEAVGKYVTAFQPGDEVYGCPGGVGDLPGALAEYQLADPSFLARKPASLSMRQAAALPLVTITAWEALFDRARLQPGQHVLIHAGAGGVGHVAVQLAKIFGAKVTATVSSEDKARIATGFGADATVNYHQESVEEYVARLTGGQGFDVVFDTVGGANLDASFQAARIKGQVVSTNTRSTHDLAPMHARALTLSVVFMLLAQLTGLGSEHQGNILAQAAKLADAGKLTPLLDASRFTLEQVAEAHNHLASGKALGKVVIDVA